MVVFRRKAKIIILLLILALAIGAGKVIEQYDGETFSEETSTTAEQVLSTETHSSVENGKININNATKDELMLLDRIGEKIAARIIEYREENGPFTQIEGLMLVPGIGEKTFDNLKDKICIE